MWRDVSDAEGATRDALIDQLHAHDIHYLGGGSGPADADVGSIDALIPALARSSDARLRTALVALLFRHPEFTPAAFRAETAEEDPRVARWIAASILAAAALQRAWVFSLNLYQLGWRPIEADALAHRLGVPPPADDYGRATLLALDRLLAGDRPVPPDYYGAWEDVGRHAIADLREEAALRATQRVIKLNVEPASPADFIPLPAGWRDRSPFMAQEGGLAIFGFDPLSTALAKIERGQERDIDDVLALCHSGVVRVSRIVEAFEEIAPRIETEALPRVAEPDFRRKVEAFAVLAQRAMDTHA